ncbi:MAG: hypothetical protein KBS95_05475 [Alistipes sp.]|nr:hypothetical protein [Candidatus Alistipes equi]
MSGKTISLIFMLYSIFGLLLYETRVLTDIDELTAFAFGLLVFIKTFTHKISFSKAFFLWILIDVFYLIYSFSLHLNEPIAVFSDFIMQSKPYMMFFALVALKPQLSRNEMIILRIFLILMLMSVLLIAYLYPHKDDSTHIGELLTGAALSSVSMIFAAAYYIFSQNDSWITRLITIIIALPGFLHPTSKFVGQLIFMIFVMFFIKKKISFNIRYILMFTAILAIVSYAIWDDFKFYFLTDSMVNARPIMYIQMPSVLVDYAPFGSGFATYASFASGTWYSPLYSKYNMEYIWGLREGEADFVADAYYPCLAQFGFVGIVLFIWLIVYVVRKSRKLYDKTLNLKQYKGSLIAVAIILIECTTASFSNERSIMHMILLYFAITPMRKDKRITQLDSFGLSFAKSIKKKVKTNENTTDK